MRHSKNTNVIPAYQYLASPQNIAAKAAYSCAKAGIQCRIKHTVKDTGFRVKHGMTE
jgi:hypothetical protein